MTGQLTRRLSLGTKTRLACCLAANLRWPNERTWSACRDALLSWGRSRIAAALLLINLSYSEFQR
jgi:hypothetical protein